MNKILEHVVKEGHFMPPQYIGGYDNIPFTHEEFCQYVDDLHKKLKSTLIDRSSDGIVEHLMHFEEDGEEFILRHMEMGEYIDQLMHKPFWDANYEVN